MNYHARIISNPKSGDYKRVVAVGRTDLDLVKNVCVSEIFDNKAGKWKDNPDVLALISGLIDGGLDWHDIDQGQAEAFTNGDEVFLGDGEKSSAEKIIARKVKDVEKAISRKLNKNYFRDHLGRPGQVGGSLPRSAGGGGDRKHKMRDPKDIESERTRQKEEQGGDKKYKVKKELLPVSGDEIKSLTDKILNAGTDGEVGFSYQVVADKHADSGVMSSEYPERNRNIALEDFTQDDLMKYIEDNADLLVKEDHYLGGWVQYGKIDLDVSRRFESKEDALKSAREHYQAGVFSLDDFKTYYVDPRFDPKDPSYDLDAINKFRAEKSAF